MHYLEYDEWAMSTLSNEIRCSGLGYVIGEISAILYVHPHAKIMLTVAMETMKFFIVQISSLRTKFLCISGVPINDMAPMKNCPGVQGRSN